MPFNVELYTSAIDPLKYEETSTKYHSGSHIIGDFCIETVNDAALTVVLTVGQLSEPGKCIGIPVHCTYHNNEIYTNI